MKCLHKDLKKQEIKLRPESQDDLWCLSQVIDPGDFVKGRTARKIKVGDAQGKAASVRKPVFLKIKVEKADFSNTSNILRLSGTIVEGPDDVPRGSYHTFNVEEGIVFTIIKQKWLKFQLDKVNEACSETAARILICVFDREEAFFALMKKYGYEILAHIKGDVQKKAVEDKKSSQFYPDVVKQLGDYDLRYNLQAIVLASPSFFKEDLMKFMKNPELNKKIIPAACSSVSRNGIDEVLKRDEVRKALSQNRIAQEMRLVEQLLAEISKDGLAAYGFKEAELAVSSGAVSTLLVSYRLIQKMREQGIYEKLDALMRLADSMKAEIRIISSDHDAGRKLDGLGGIGAILRFKMSY